MNTNTGNELVVKLRELPLGHARRRANLADVLAHSRARRTGNGEADENASSAALRGAGRVPELNFLAEPA